MGSCVQGKAGYTKLARLPCPWHRLEITQQPSLVAFGEGGCARDQQRSNRAHTGGSSLLIPVLIPSPAAPSPDPSSPAVWNVPAPSRLVQPLSCSLIHCSCAGAASMAPGATGVPRHLAGDCLASLPARGGGTAPSIRASAASGRRKVSSSPLRDVLMTTGPKAASPPPTEALSGQQHRLLPGGCPSLPLEAQGASLATGHSPSRPFPRAWGEIPSPRLCGSGWIQLQGHTQPVTAPQTRSPDAGSCCCSPTTGKGVVPPLNQEESPPQLHVVPEVQHPWRTDKPRDTMSACTPPCQLENPQKSAAAGWDRWGQVPWG